MSVVVLIPVNRFDGAKTRLGSILPADAREQLAIATFTTVARAVHEAGLTSIALTPKPERVRAMAAVTEVVGESPQRHGLNEQVEGLAPHIGDEVLVLHADLPLATGDAIMAFLKAAGESDVAIVRSADGGTNAMLLRPPGRFRLAYGKGSFAAHDGAARAAGLRVTHVDSAELALDLDTAEDLETLMTMPGGKETEAGRLLLPLLRPKE